MVAVSRKVSRKHAMELLLTGDLIPAAEALRIGLINRTAPSGQAREAAIELAQQIATKSPAAIRHGKRAFYRQAEMSLADAYRLATQVMADNMMEAETQEGIAAFFEKRKPVWTEKP
jgi:enoyl-CoA hydratase/carnithine racemase